MSLRQEIFNRFVAALGEIKTVRGYAHDVASSQKIRLTNTDIGRPSVITTMPEEDKDLSRHDHYMCSLQFESSCYVEEVNEDDADNPSIEDRCNEFLEDVERAILEENQKPHPLGLPYVQDIELGGHQLNLEASPQGFLVFGKIHYRHSLFSSGVA